VLYLSHDPFSPTRHQVCVCFPRSPRNPPENSFGNLTALCFGFYDPSIGTLVSMPFLDAVSEPRNPLLGGVASVRRLRNDLVFVHLPENTIVPLGHVRKPPYPVLNPTPSSTFSIRLIPGRRGRRHGGGRMA
jgi:hypothetical protein